AVAGVAVVDLGVNGHGAVGGHRAVVQQLLEVGAVVLVVAAADARGAVGRLGGRLVGVFATQGDGGGVLVKLTQRQREAVDDAQDEGGQEAGAFGAVVVIEGVATAVVVEQVGLPRGKAEVFGDEK